MSVLERLRAALGAPGRGLARRAGRSILRPLHAAALRAFEMAAAGRLTASWTGSTGPINQEIYHQLPTMVARSRDLWANDAYAKRFMTLMKDGVIGPRGVRLKMNVEEIAPGDAARDWSTWETAREVARAKLDKIDRQARAGRLSQHEARGKLAAVGERLRQLNGNGPRRVPDVMANLLIEQAWQDFGKLGQFDVSGRLTRLDCENLFVEGLVREGEALVRMVPGFDNRHGMALHFMDTDRLDLQRNSQPQDPANHVVMGVEQDTWGRAQRYWVLNSYPSHAGLFGGHRGGHQVYDAREIVHAFLTARPEQARGIPWMHAASVALKDLHGYREAAVVAARVGAAKLLWLRSPDGVSSMGEPNAAGEHEYTAEPGEMGRLAEGEEIVEWNPQYPHDQFGAFNSALLHGVASAFNVAQFSLSGDLSSVNFSTARVGLQAERDFYRAIQRFVIARFHQRVFERWLSVQLNTGRINLPASKFRIYNAPLWKARTWEHIQPREQTASDATLFGLNAKSLTEIIETRGQRERDEVLMEIADDRAALDRLNLPLSWPTTVTEQPPTDDQGNPLGQGTA